MDAKKAKDAILDALDDLEKNDLERFCSALRDRREEPRIRRSAIENKNRIEIADKLVTTFTEDNAVEVTLDILKKINCNDVAKELENWREYSKAVVADVSVCLFSVVVQQTEASTRCGLQGTYWLQVGEEGMTLLEAEMKSVFTWPYNVLRRYGKDELLLSFEAGRRCDSGPGLFNFKTAQNDEIYTLIKIAIQREAIKHKGRPP